MKVPNHDWQVEPRRRLQSLVRGHRKGVRSFRWIQSHKLVISGGLERDLIVWNPYTGKVPPRLIKSVNKTSLYWQILC